MSAAWRWAALLLIALSAGGVRGAALGDNTVRLSPSKLRMPQNIGPLRFSGESRFSDRRLGRAYGFNTSGISLSIYVYDYGVRGVPDGPDSVPLCEQFEAAKLEIERGGNYDNVRLLSEVSRPLSDAEGAPVAREALYEFDRRGIHARSVLWLTAADGFFLKLRLSLRQEVADELDEARDSILAALGQAMEQRRRTVKPVASAPSAAESIEMDATAPGESADWLAYAAELMTQSRQHPQRRPPCGGLWVPGYAAELAARRALLASHRTREPAQPEAVYLQELSRVESAGFLDEYVWQFLRDARVDVTPPPELELAAFEAFRQREMPGHEPRTGARIRIHAVRALPAP